LSTRIDERPSMLDVTYEIDRQSKSKAKVASVWCAGRAERRPVSFCKKFCDYYRMMGIGKMVCGWDVDDEDPPERRGGRS